MFNMYMGFIGLKWWTLGPFPLISLYFHCCLAWLLTTYLPHRISPVDPSLAALCVPGTTFSLWWMLLSQHLIATQLRNDHQNLNRTRSEIQKEKKKIKE